MIFAPALLLSLTGFAAAQICIDPLIVEGTGKGFRSIGAEERISHLQSATVFTPTGQTACGNTNIPQGAFVAGLPLQFFNEFQ
jgi:hypothetical protein